MARGSDSSTLMWIAGIGAALYFAYQWAQSNCVAGSTNPLCSLFSGASAALATGTVAAGAECSATGQGATLAYTCGGISCTQSGSDAAGNLLFTCGGVVYEVQPNGVVIGPYTPPSAPATSASVTVPATAVTPPVPLPTPTAPAIQNVSFAGSMNCPRGYFQSASSGQPSNCQPVSTVSKGAIQPKGGRIH
jgi:hypothetical protein